MNHHTASRVIQFCIKHGGETERKAVMEEVRANIVELSKSKYGHFLVRKLINTAKKDEVPGEWSDMVSCTVRGRGRGSGVDELGRGGVLYGPANVHPVSGRAMSLLAPAALDPSPICDQSALPNTSHARN